MLSQYLKYRLKAKGIHHIHSPFLFEFYKNVLRFEGDATTNMLSKKLSFIRNSDEMVEITQFGAGSRSGSVPKTIGEIARRSGTSKRWGRILYKMASITEGSVIELGTNLGLGTAYLAKGSNQSVFSIEGCPNLFRHANDLLRNLDCDNVNLINQDIDSVNFEELTNGATPGLVYIDANHTYEATMRYFNLFVELMNGSGIIVIDDIHWSADMTKAWEEIKNHDKVTISVDMFYKGFLFFDTAYSKQNFILK